MVSDRLDRFLSDVNLRAIDHADIEQALYAALMACADLTLDEEVDRASAHGACRRPANFPISPERSTRNGIQRTAAALADWLRVQQKRGLIELDDAEEAAGMLLGMVASAPRRAAMFGGVPLPSRAQIEARVRKCVGIFLRGYRAT